VSFRIRWLDIELTEALLIKGRWFWRRCALVLREEKPDFVRWKFAYSESICAEEIVTQLERERIQMRQFGHDDLDWHRHRSKHQTGPFPKHRRLKALP
jgi:hypothetical protein